VSAPASPRACGACDLCCTLLRVDELGKPAGRDCVHLRRPGHGCAIHPRRPQVCRDYRCLWLRGGLDDADRPDRLGALLDVVSDGAGGARLDVREAAPGAFERSPRLRAIAKRYRASLPVRVLGPDAVHDPDAPIRILLPDGEEQQVAGDRVSVRRDGEVVARRRAPWLERQARRLALRWRAHRLRHLRGPGAGSRTS